MQNNISHIAVLVASFLLLIILGGAIQPVLAQSGNISVGSGGGGIKNPLEKSGSTTITHVLKGIINWMLGLVGFLALIALIIGGARMIIDFGNEDQVKKAKMTITWAIIGLMVVILSYAIINIVVSDILGGSGGSSSGSTL
jgi:hypothetical protein